MFIRMDVFEPSVSQRACVCVCVLLLLLLAL